MQFDIVLLQETQSEKCKESIWNNEWGAENLYSHGENNACGTMIMFRPELPIEIKKCTTSDKGRYILADIEIENKQLCLANVYAPNEDSPEFFNEVLCKITSHESGDIIMGGI